MAADPHSGEIFELCNIIRETSFQIHIYLRSGFTEKIYENALVNRLRKNGIQVEQQKRMKVFDEDGTLLGLPNSRLICRQTHHLRNQKLYVFDRRAHSASSGLSSRITNRARVAHQLWRSQTRGKKIHPHLT